MPDRTKPLKDYAKAISANLSRGDATEHTHRPALKALLEAAWRGVTATNEPRRVACGAPDYIISKGPVTVGYVEAKDVEEDLTKIERTDQLKRYLASLPNLILTDYVEFRWYTDGQPRETARLGMVGTDGTIKTTTSSLEQVSGLLDKFMQHKSPSAGTAKELAVRMAHLARMIRDVAEATFSREEETGTLHSQYQAFKEVLLPELGVGEFADMFAQTIAYGLFAARHGCPGRGFTRQNAAWNLPKTNPFLRKLFSHIAGPDLDDRIAWIVDDLAQVLADAEMDAIVEDFLARVRKEDPVVHFYETFLAEYNPKMRKLRGVYYTPEPVVSYIVRSVDYLLRSRFGCALGLADPNVLILDPACGTGTFLASTVKLIHERMVEQGQAGGWNDYVPKHLLPRLFGFELLMAPYAIAHLKLGLVLEQTGYEFDSDERLHIYLTNALQEAVKGRALPFAEYISDEANAAAEIKREKPIMVVLGNPPYSGHSANKGPWINGLLKGTLPDRTKAPSYYEVDGKPLGERNPKMLQDDYVKFIRFGQWRIEQTGYGILAYISNNGYLDNPTFRGMRQQLMNAFSEISILDLHGNTRKKERAPDGCKDENVFDIQQGVAIGVFLRERNGQGLATVRHADLWGSRQRDKYAALSATEVSSTTWAELTPGRPFYLFGPRGTALAPEYQNGWRIHEALPVHSGAMNTARDHLVVDIRRTDLARRLEQLADPRLGASELAERYGVHDTGWWSLGTALDELRNTADYQRLIVRCLYRPFDVRWLFLHPSFIDRPREEVNRHMQFPNLSLVTTRQTKEGFAAMATTHICGQHKIVTVYDRSYVAPLYLYPDPETNGDLFSNGLARHANLNPEFVADIEKRLGLEFVPDGKGDLGRPDTPVGQDQRCGYDTFGSRDKSVPPTGGGVGSDLTRRRHHLPHWQQGGSVYFITFRSARATLPQKALRPVLEAIRYDHGRTYDLYLAVAMPDHTHMLLQPREKTPGIWYDLAEIMKGIKGVSARRINQLLGTVGTVWQEESFDRIVRNEQEFLEKWNYMLNNPVKRGLVSEHADYQFFLSPETSGRPDTPVGQDQQCGYDALVSRDKSVPPTDEAVPPADEAVPPTGTFGPEDVFDYIYAVFHSPTYRTRYAEFLKIDFPRVPLTSDRNLFRRLVEKGAELVALHLMESPALDNLITKYPVVGSDIVEKVRYDEVNRRVYINKEQYFAGVEPEVWGFHVGGYQVLEKWLKDRKGRKLIWQDQQHYQKVVVALTETMRLMREIDQAIPAWPIS